MVVIDDARLTFTAPERSLEQRMVALRNANRIRSYRAQLKREIKRGDRRFIDVLESDDPLLASMKVYDLLLAVPALGSIKVRTALDRARISPSKTVGGLTARQRQELVFRLAAWPSVAASVRDVGTMES